MAKFLAFLLVGFGIASSETMRCCEGFSSSVTHHHHCRARSTISSIPTINTNTQNLSITSSTSISMGLLDFIKSNNPFLNSREGDFVPLEGSDTFGPGPLILMYAVPASLGNDELMDMVEDGMPNRQDVVIRRIPSEDKGGDELLGLTVEDALEKAMKLGCNKVETPLVVSSQQDETCPLLYFSGVSNNEMMDTYRIIANEIYEETNRVHWPACAKVVSPAMKKPLRKVLLEISGDHADAMKMRKEEAERASDEGK